MAEIFSPATEKPRSPPAVKQGAVRFQHQALAAVPGQRRHVAELRRRHRRAPSATRDPRAHVVMSAAHLLDLSSDRQAPPETATRSSSSVLCFQPSGTAMLSFTARSVAAAAPTPPCPSRRPPSVWPRLPRSRAFECAKLFSQPPRSARGDRQTRASASGRVAMAFATPRREDDAHSPLPRAEGLIRLLPREMHVDLRRRGCGIDAYHLRSAVASAPVVDEVLVHRLTDAWMIDP